MNKTLRWISFESVMFSLFAVNGISASKFNRFKGIQIGILEYSS
jgi:hypothetical protein